MKTLVGIYFLMIVSVGYAQSNDSDVSEKYGGKSFVRLIPIKSEDEIMPRAANGDDRYDTEIIRTCVRGTEATAVLPAIIASFVGSAINIGLDSINKKLKKKIESHSKSYSASFSGAYPEDVRCWRVVRGNTGDDGKSESFDLELVFLIKSFNGASELSPLRLWYAKPAPTEESVSGKYGLAMNVEYRAANSYQTLDLLALKDSLVFTGEPVTKYYGLKEKCPRTDLPIYCGHEARVLLPSTEPNNPVDFSVKLAEVGEVSGLLKFAQKLFEGNKDAVGKTLGELAASKINPE